MTPQQFVESIDLPEARIRAAIVTRLPMVVVAEWLRQVVVAAGTRWDRYETHPSPMRLHCFIDGVREPRLSVIVYDAWRNEPMVGAKPDRTIEDLEL